MTTQIAKVRALIPAKDAIFDSIAALGGRQQLTVEVLGKALGSYFPEGDVVINGNDIVINSPSTKEEAYSAYFSGAKDAVIEDHKFALVLRSPALSAGVTFLRADGTELMARPILDVEGLVKALGEFWPEKNDDVKEGLIV